MFLSDASNAVLASHVGYGYILNDDTLQHTTIENTDDGSNRLVLEIAESDFNLIENGETIAGGDLTLPTIMELIGDDATDDSLLLSLLPSATNHLVSFAGGVAGNDSLVYRNGSFETILHQWTTAGDGRTELTPFSGGDDSIVEWTQIESLQSDLGGVPEMIFHLADEVTDATLSHDGELLQLSSQSNAFAPISFRRPTESLVIRSSGEDFLTVIPGDPELEEILSKIENFVPDPLGDVTLEDGNLLVTMPLQDDAGNYHSNRSATDQYVITLGHFSRSPPVRASVAPWPTKCASTI